MEGIVFVCCFLHKRFMNLLITEWTVMIELPNKPSIPSPFFPNSIIFIKEKEKVRLVEGNGMDEGRTGNL